MVDPRGRARASCRHRQLARGAPAELTGRAPGAEHARRVAARSAVSRAASSSRRAVAPARAAAVTKPAHPALAGGRADDDRLRAPGGVEQAPVVRDGLGLERARRGCRRRPGRRPRAGRALPPRRCAGTTPRCRARRRACRRCAGRRSARRRRRRRCARTTGAPPSIATAASGSALSGSPILPSAWQARAHSSSSRVAQRGGQLGHGVERAQLAEHDDDQAPPLRVARVAEQRAQLGDGVRAGVEQHLGHRALAEDGRRPRPARPRISSSRPSAPTRVSACAHAKRTSGSRSRRPLRSAGTLSRPPSSPMTSAPRTRCSTRRERSARSASAMKPRSAKLAASRSKRRAGELVRGLEQRLAQQPPLEGRQRARQLVGDLDRERRDALAHAHAHARRALAHAAVGQQHAHVDGRAEVEQRRGRRCRAARS